MTSFQNPQSHLPPLLKFAEGVRSAKLQLHHSFQAWVRQHIVDDDPYETHGACCPIFPKSTVHTRCARGQAMAISEGTPKATTTLL